MNDKQTGWTLLVGAALAIGGGLFLPWATLSAPLVGTINVYGNEGDGIIAAVGGLLAGIAGLVVLNSGRTVPAKVMAFLAAGIVGLVALTDLPNVQELAGSEDFASVGTGLWAVALSAVLIVVALGVLLFSKQPANSGSRKPSSPSEAETGEPSRPTEPHND